jgi:lipoprotein-anchoring transpeptidase ErfK/SrfK
MLSRRDTFALATGFFAASALPGLAQEAREGFAVPEHLQAVFVRIPRSYETGQIIVNLGKHVLYYVTEPGRAIRYGIGIGREGLNFRGEAVVGRKEEWPDWRPTPEMIERNPDYARWEEGMPGGPGNPLGARALYLYQNGRDTAFRIHGTVDPSSVGQSVSNGCIRMYNEYVIDLYERVPLGTKVTVG